MLVYVIDQRFRAAALCALIAAAASWLGLLHAWRFTAADTVFQLGWGAGAPWALGYLAMAVVFLVGWGARRRVAPPLSSKSSADAPRSCHRH